MFSDQLIDQLSLFIIRPHRQIYGLDKLGPKKLIIKSVQNGCYIQVHRQQSTILSEGKKIQLSVFVPYTKSLSCASFEIETPGNFNRFYSNANTQTNYSQRSRQLTIFLHTNSGSRLQGVEYCKYLLQHGHIVCLFDYSGSGVSQGQFVSMGLNQSKDLANVFKFLQQKYQIEKTNLWGRSMGAVTAVLYCSKYPHTVNKMVLDSPFCSFRQLVKQIVNAKTGLPQFLYGIVLNRIQQNIKRILNINLMDIDLKQQISKIGMQKIPIFFLISKDDKLVQPIHVETLYQLHRGYKKIIYLQGSHNKPRSSQIRQQCADFLCNRINNTNSQKSFQYPKKQYLSLINKKQLQQSAPYLDAKMKTTSSSLIFSSPQFCQTPNMGNYLQSSLVISKDRNLYHHNEQPLLNLNFVKPNKEQTSQPSIMTTPRQDHSLGKYPCVSGSKISLSQLKKNQAQIEPIVSHTAINRQGHIQVSLQNQMNNRNTPTNPFKNSQVDFKKHSKTMAIQYKNKMKEHINKM